MLTATPADSRLCPCRQVVPGFVPRQRSNQRLPVTVDIVDDLGQQISGRHTYGSQPSNQFAGVAASGVWMYLRRVHLPDCIALRQPQLVRTSCQRRLARKLRACSCILPVPSPDPPAALLHQAQPWRAGTVIRFFSECLL